MTINVGLGTGGKAQQFAQTMAIANVQKELVAAGKTNMVGDKELYNTAVELTRIMGHKNAARFFKDPSEVNPRTGQLVNPPPPPHPDPKVAAVQAKAQADIQHQKIKTEADTQLAQLKADLDAKLAILDAHIKALGETRSAHHDNERHRTKLAGDVLDVITKAHRHDVGMAQPKPAQVPPGGTPA
jgi:hypothetical protein